MNSYIVRWSANGYCVEFYYKIVAESLNNAKMLWDKYVNVHPDIQYSWEKAVRGVENHYGGYIEWKDSGVASEKKGCYVLEKVNTFYGSDHLRD